MGQAIVPGVGSARDFAMQSVRVVGKKKALSVECADFEKDPLAQACEWQWKWERAFGLDKLRIGMNSFRVAFPLCALSAG